MNEHSIFLLSWRKIFLAFRRVARGSGLKFWLPAGPQTQDSRLTLPGSSKTQDSLPSAGPRLKTQDSRQGLRVSEHEQSVARAINTKQQHTNAHQTDRPHSRSHTHTPRDPSENDVNQRRRPTDTDRARLTPTHPPTHANDRVTQQNLDSDLTTAAYSYFQSRFLCVCRWWAGASVWDRGGRGCVYLDCEDSNVIVKTTHAKHRRQNNSSRRSAKSCDEHVDLYALQPRHVEHGTARPSPMAQADANGRLRLHHVLFARLPALH